MSQLKQKLLKKIGMNKDRFILQKLFIDFRFLKRFYNRDVNILIFLDFSFRCDSVHQKY